MTAAWLCLASALFWLSWLLMPGVGVTDTAIIFELVSQRRSEVFASVALQLVSAAAYAPGTAGLLLAEHAHTSRTLRLGCVLLLIGAMGSAADAIFHLVAFEMTAPNVLTPAMIPVMQRLQGPDLGLLLPMVFAFFAGHGLVAWAWRQKSPLARRGLQLQACIPLIIVAGAVARKADLVSGRVVGLAVLAALSASLALVGLGVARLRPTAAAP